jgi:transposase
MGQRSRMLAEIWGFDGWKVVEALFETADGRRVEAVGGYALLRETKLVLVVARRWMGRCSQCTMPCRKRHELLPTRRWADLPWAGHPVEIEYAPCRLKCPRCDGASVEMLAWADPYQRQSRRLQQHLAIEAASMPVMHVAALHGLSWLTVRRAEEQALARWESTRPTVVLRQVGVDEKWLGRRHKREHKYVTIVSNLETGEPVWIGYGRGADTLKAWLAVLTLVQKAEIQLFAMDMHRPFLNAVREDATFARIPIVHDPFHIMKRAGEAITELRRQVFFRADAEMRGIGRGTRWLVLRAWEKTTEEQRARLHEVFSFNPKLANAYQVVEELREALHAPDAMAMMAGIGHVLRRTQRRDNVPMRKLHDSLLDHFAEIVALGEHHPPTGRIEALNNNWETLVRRARGYRDHNYLLCKLRFMVANPIRSADGLKRFVALGVTPPMPMRRAA